MTLARGWVYVGAVCGEVQEIGVFCARCRSLPHRLLVIEHLCRIFPWRDSYHGPVPGDEPGEWDAGFSSESDRRRSSFWR